MAKRRGKNEGSIRQRKDGLWEGAITVGVTDKGNPKRRSVYGKTRAETAKKLNELLLKHQQGSLPALDRVTVAEYLARHLEGKTHLAQKTRSTYQQTINHLLSTPIGDVRLQNLRPANVRDCYTALSNRGLSPRSQRKAATFLCSALADAVHEEIITRNPAQAVKVKTGRVERKAEAWTREEVSSFLAVAKDDVLYPIFYLMLALGLRRGEVLGLSWDDVDFSEATLKVRQALTLPGDSDTPIIKAVKTPKSRRTLYLSRDVLTVLSVRRERQRAERAYLGETWTDNGLIFTTALGTPLHPRNLTRSFKRLTAAAGLREIRIHDLRHTYASLALQRGTPVEIVSERLGHSSVGFTLDTYRHLYEAERREAAVSLDDLLGIRTQPRAVN
jgi:integrase